MSNTQLTQLPESDESRRVGVLARKLRIRVTSATALHSAPADVVALLPADVAVEHGALPVELDGDGVLTVAMADPSDEQALAEIGFFTGRYIARTAAAPSALGAALVQHLKIALPSRRRRR
jgi:hypothetical protein